MPFVTDQNGNIKFVNAVPVTTQSGAPGPVPIVTPPPVQPSQSGVMIVTVTVSGVPVIVHSGEVPVHQTETHKDPEERHIAKDDVIRIVQVPPDFPPKPFKMSDYVK